MIKKVGLAVTTVAVSMMLAGGVAFAQTTSPSPSATASPSPSATTTTVPSSAPSTGMGG